MPGNHTLSDLLVVSNVTNFTFRGVDSTYVLGVASSVKIICNHSYIIFKHSIKLTIQNLILYGCGVYKVSENNASENSCLPSVSFMHGSDFCKLTSSLNFNRVLNLKISNIRVEYSTGISAQNILGKNSCTFHGAASNITKETTSPPPSVCIEFTYIQLSALPSNNHLSIHNSIFKYRQGPSVVAIFRQLHYTIYFHINNISTFQTGSICSGVCDIQLHILTKQQELVYTTISNSSLTHSNGCAIYVNAPNFLGYYTYFSSISESSKMLGDVTIASSEIVDYFSGGLLASLHMYLQFVIQDCAFMGSHQGTANPPGISVLGKYRHQSNKDLIILQNLSVLYNEAFPHTSVARLTNVHDAFLIDCYFIGNKGTALTVQSSTFYTQGNLKFINNSAFQKGALALLKTATWCLITILALFFKTTIPHTWGVLFM